MFIDEDIVYVVTTDFPTLVYIPSTIPIQKILNDILIVYVCRGVWQLEGICSLLLCEFGELKPYFQAW